MRSGAARFPAWLKKRIPPEEKFRPVLNLLRELGLRTVCQEARCPNIGECFAAGTATFMILGRVCTRDCAFCAVESGEPAPLDPDEPRRIAEAAARLGLAHVVVTSVTRDDLSDGGSAHFAAVVAAIRERCDARVEVLTPDFQGMAEDIARVVAAGPHVYNHNVETAPRLYRDVRPQADYGRSLQLLRQVSETAPATVVKSGLMLGLGETEAEVIATMCDLRAAGCQTLTLGQYLSPSAGHHPVVEFVEPERFRRFKNAALDMGFRAVASGPFVRSSYHAEQMAAAAFQDMGTGDGRHF